LGLQSFFRMLNSAWLPFGPQVCTSKMNLSDEVDLEDYVSRPDKISAAEIAAICQEAGMLAVRKNRCASRRGSAIIPYHTIAAKSRRASLAAQLFYSSGAAGNHRAIFAWYGPMHRCCGF
jgi:hypothetical protein